jgi:hypothetical protein
MSDFSIPPFEPEILTILVDRDGRKSELPLGGFGRLGGGTAWDGMGLCIEAMKGDLAEQAFAFKAHRTIGAL